MFNERLLNESNTLIIRCFIFHHLTVPLVAEKVVSTGL